MSASDGCAGGADCDVAGATEDAAVAGRDVGRGRATACAVVASGGVVGFATELSAAAGASAVVAGSAVEAVSGWGWGGWAGWGVAAVARLDVAAGGSGVAAFAASLDGSAGVRGWRRNHTVNAIPASNASAAMIPPIRAPLPRACFACEIASADLASESDGEDPGGGFAGDVDAIGDDMEILGSDGVGSGSVRSLGFGVVGFGVPLDPVVAPPYAPGGVLPGI